MKVSRTYLAIFLISTATLTYEIGLTRLFSLAQGYHFAFMVISIALMGIGAGGAALMALDWGKQKDRSKTLAVLAAASSITIIISYIAANRILFDPIKASWSKTEFIKILFQYLILSLPFMISGMIMSGTIRSMSERVHRIYSSDMAGAATGCILILFVLSRTGGEGAIIVAAALLLAASILFFTPMRVTELFLPVIALLLLAAVLLGPWELLKTNISPYRDITSVQNFPGGRIVDTIFSPSGRMDIIESPAVRAAPGISLSYQVPLPPQLGFTINGGGLATVTSRAGDTTFLKHLPSALPYRLRRGAEVFVVDPGGGMEVLSALENGASAVWGAETNRVVLEAMKGRLSTFSGGLYDEVHILHGYGRNVLKKLQRDFDIIQVPHTGTLGSSSSGIRGLQEDFSLTTEALGKYLDHLKEGGIVSISLYLLPPPRQELKLLSTVIEALADRGVKTPEQRIIAIRSWGVLTLLVKNGAVEEQDIAALRTFSESEGFDLVWYPGMKAEEANIHNRFQEPIYHNLFRKLLDTTTREDFMKEYIFDVRPATDDRPFFGQTFKMTRIKETYESVGRKWGILIEGGYLLPWILLQATVASLILIMAPLLFMKKEKSSLKTLFHTGSYFAAIGVGFMLVEISLIHKLMPMLGEPIYAISAVLFSILLSTGAGSYLSGRFTVMERYSPNAMLVLPVLILTYLVILGPLTSMMTGFTVALRYILTFALLFPLGVAMGVPFPTGMALLGKRQANLIPWAWCINGSFSVISSVLVMMVAMAWGFKTALIIAAVAYGGAWLALSRLYREI